MLGNIGPLEIGIVLVVALLVFGPKKLPELGQGLGKGMREFKEGVTGDHKDEPDVLTPAPPVTVVEDSSSAAARPDASG